MVSKNYLTVCLSPSIQKTLIFNDFIEDEVNRCSIYLDDASGKGVNVSRVLRQLGGQVVHLTQAGGPLKKNFEKELKRHGINHLIVNSKTGMRFCYTIINTKKNTTTELVEESRKVNEKIESKILEKYRKALKKCRTVIISGSKAPGFSDNIFPEMVKLAKCAGKRVILDIRGKDLLGCLSFRPDIIKPNLEEFTETFSNRINLDNGSSLINKVEDIMLDLEKQHGICTVISRGRDSLLYTDNHEIKYLPVEKIRAVNTTGCGDTFTAALAYYMDEYGDLKAALLRAVKSAALNAGSYRPGTIIDY